LNCYPPRNCFSPKNFDQSPVNEKKFSIKCKSAIKATKSPFNNGAIKKSCLKKLSTENGNLSSFSNKLKFKKLPTENKNSPTFSNKLSLKKLATDTGNLLSYPKKNTKSLIDLDYIDTTPKIIKISNFYPRESADLK